MVKSYRMRMRGASCSHRSTHCCSTRSERSSEDGDGAEDCTYAAFAEDPDSPDLTRPSKSEPDIIGTDLTVISSLSTLNGLPKLKLQKLIVIR